MKSGLDGSRMTELISKQKDLEMRIDNKRGRVEKDLREAEYSR